MSRVLRIAGFLMIATGGLLAASWFIEPLRELWPMLLELPLAIRIGLAVAGLGLLIVFASVLHDRLAADERSLDERIGGDP